MNTRWFHYLSSLSLFLACICLTPQVYAQNSTEEASEVYLDFRHRGVINTVVIAYYKDDKFYLPINELFSQLQFDNTISELTVSGKYASKQTPYSLDFQTNVARIGDKIIALTTKDYLLTDLDFYITAALFEKLFQLRFTIDFSNLTLNLESSIEIPIVQKILRDQKRNRANRNRNKTENYDLKYDRVKPLIDGGFIDYNLSSTVNSTQNLYNFSSNVGLQLAGGDLQGTIYGSSNDNFSTINTNGLRWRYLFRESTILTRLTLGQTRSDGIIQNPYTGIRISNSPIEPRFSFDEYEVHGSTLPQSEVELYLNNLLIDYQQANELGDYRFLAPISYGTSQFDIKIYGPTGQIIERSNRIQIPFNFQPKGVFNYNFNIGQLDNPILGSTERNYIAHGSGALGLTEWLTLKSGVEYYDGINNNKPTLTSTLSSRILSKYIFTLEGVSNSYYRGALNVIYPNSTSFNLDYTNYTKTQNIYNTSGDDKRIIGSLFYPFLIRSTPFNLRLSSYTRIRANGNSTSYRIDASTNLGKLNVRLGYSDRSTGAFDPLNPSTTSSAEASMTYNFTQNANIPKFLRGFFIRTSFRYMPAISEVESVDLLISRNILKQGRFQLSYGRNFKNQFNTIRFNLIIDFNKVRSSSTFSQVRGVSSFAQNIRGSIGYDTNYNNFLFTSRDQVGRAGAAIKLFVDNNNNSKFDEGDDPINENALRINRSGASSTAKNGVVYFSQMQPYYFYNMELNKGAINNPMLVPDFDKFGVITDPNRFKKIEIPFYMSGVIEGSVHKVLENSTKQGVGGLKLTLKKINSEYTTELRTFGDGSFYAYEIPPGKYSLSIEQAQLGILKSTAEPSSLEFEIKAIPEGDFVEGLEFLLRPEDYTPPDIPPANAKEIITEIKQSTEILEYEKTLSNKVNETLRLIILAQNEFYQRDIEGAFKYVNESLKLFETAQGYALKGSLYYLKGNKIEAQQSWDKAIRFNPDIFIPDVEVLDQLIKTEFMD